jgi:hypothetical protein
MNVTLYWYNLESESGRTIDKGKTQVMFPTVIAVPNGFVLAEIVGKQKLVYLNPEGEYLKRQYLADFEGWRDDLVLKEIVSVDNRMILNLDNQTRSRVTVALLDVEQQSINYIHEYPLEKGLETRFYPWQDGYLELNQHTGFLQFLSSKFDQPQILHPGYEPRRTDPKKRLARRLPFRPTLWPVAVSDHRITFIFNKPDPYATEKYPDSLRRTLHLEGNQVTEGETIILGEYKGKQLHYHPVEQEFSIIRDQKQED